MAKRILRKFQMSEISGVDRMAQEGAKLVIMKRDDPDEIAKGAFMDAVTVMEAEEAIRELWWDLWESEEAMHRAVCMIVDNPARYPDVQTAIIEALGEYSAKVQEQAAEVAATVPSMGDGEEPSSTDPTMKSDHSGGDKNPELIPEEEPAMTKNTEPTVESLTAELARAESFGKLNDVQKAHYATLDDAGKDSFLKMDDAAKAGVIAKAAEINPVVYTAADGTEFRKSDDPRMISMAKRADESEKREREEIAKRETLEMTKRANDELGALPGSVNSKVALLKAINGIKDEATVTEINQLLTAANNGLAKAFETSGTTTPAVGSPEEKLNVLAKAHAEKKGIPFAKAYTEVLETDEGKALYTQTLA